MAARIRHMRAQSITLLFASICCFCAASCGSRPPVGFGPQVADDLGTLRAPLDLGNARAAVLIFAGVECPISNAYSPEINRLCDEYAKRQVKFYVVYADSELSRAVAREHARSYGIVCTVLLDPRHELTRMLSATVTPEAVVVGPRGNVLYRGRIDDLYLTLGHRRYEAHTHDLKDALDAVLAGRPIANPYTQAIGCSINT